MTDKTDSIKDLAVIQCEKPKRWRPDFMTYVFGFIALIAAWWNQPYWGWNYCLGQGVMHETDFIEMLRPRLVAIGISEQLESGKIKFAKQKAKEEKFANEKADEAIKLMKQCVQERRIQHCRYVGPDPSALIQMQQERLLFEIPNNERDKYIYIVDDATVALSILPNGLTDFSGYQGARLHYRAMSWDENRKYSYSSCVPGCTCDPSISD